MGTARRACLSAFRASRYPARMRATADIADIYSKLFKAFKNDNAQKVECLLQQNSNANLDLGWVLHWAGSDGRMDIVELMLCRDANLLHRDDDQALHRAVQSNTPELARRLLNRGADAVAVAKRALRDKRGGGDVLRGLDVLTGDIPAEQREKLLALNAKAFPAIQASVEAKQRLAQVVLVTAVRVALPGEP